MHTPQKIPTLLGLFTLAGLVVLIIWASESFFRLDTKATTNQKPQNINITNISDEMFTVTWLTPDPATGTVTATPEKGKRLTAFDERDVNGTPGSYTTHSVTIRGATAQTSYKLSLISQGRASDLPTITTAPQLSGATGGLEPAYGVIVTATEAPAVGALVYLTLAGGQTLSTLTKPSGSWLIPLSTVRKEDLSAYLPLEERINEEISVYHENQQSFATSDTLNDSPLPQMTIGQSYDFKKIQAKTLTATPPLAVAIPSTEPTVLGNQTYPDKPHKVTIVSPAQNSAVPSFFPNVYGTGIPGKSVTVTIGITRPESATVQVGTDGIWRYKVREAVGIGRQSLTITTVDAYGKPVAITHLFEILKSGTQVLGDATPSATLTPEPTLEPTPEPVTTGEPMPVSGNEIPTILLTLVGLLLLGGGALVVIR